MNQEQFEKLCAHIKQETTDLLVLKGAEYAGDEDRLANFKRGAQLTGIDPLTVLFIYMSKHYDALASYIREPKADAALSEPITGRLADLINYCTLAWALIEEGRPTVTTGQVNREPVVIKRKDDAPVIMLMSAAGKVATIAVPEEQDLFIEWIRDRNPKSEPYYQGMLLESWSNGDNLWRKF